jgi:hypothetical protein
MPRSIHLLVLALSLAACKSNSQSSPVPLDIQAHPTLVQVASCETLAQSVQDLAARQMRAQMDGEKTWAALPGTVAGATPSAPTAAAPASYSTTNTQVAGVDEADFMKNDGTRIFVLSGQTLFAATSWPPQDLAVAGKLRIEGWPSEMFLDGDQLAVFSSIWTLPPGGAMGPGSSPVGGGMAPLPIVCGLDGAGCFFGFSTTKITVVDVSTLSTPKVVSEIYLPGASAGARRVGSSVRLVLTDRVRWPAGLTWWPAWDPTLYQDRALLGAAIAALEDKNEAIIRATPIQSWFPDGQRKLADGTTVDVSYQCGDFFLPNASEQLGLVTIATLDLAHLDQGVSRASIVGDAGLLYATASHLYIASEHWWWTQLAGQRDFTYLHEFDISDPAKATYLGSGGVEGHIGDQFAMDEQDGSLRVATTTVTYQADPKTPNSFVFDTSNQLTVLSQPTAGSGLTVVGQLAPLEDGERLMSTRFVGKAGYVVTFRNFDPLVTIDLTDPAHPKKVAELTLPGFSTYLQPIDAGHLLAIGEDLPLDAGGHPDFSKRAVDLSLFDVTDLSNPRRTAQALVGTASAYSEALWDHRAFNWYQPDPSQPGKGLLAIPFSDWIPFTAGQPWWQGFVSDVRVFSVDLSQGIAPLGALTMSDIYIQEGSGDWTWFYRPWVRRSVMITDTSGNTYVYAVSDAGLRDAALGSLGTPIATALFPAQ